MILRAQALELGLDSNVTLGKSFEISELYFLFCEIEMLPPLAGCSEVMYIRVVNCAKAASDKDSEAELEDLGSH